MTTSTTGPQGRPAPTSAPSRTAPAPSNPTALAPPKQRQRKRSLRSLVVPVTPEDRRTHLLASIEGLRESQPALSAYNTINQRQRKGLIIAGVAALLMLVIFPSFTLVLIGAVTTMVYSLAVGFRIVCFKRGLGGGSLIRVSDEDALNAPAATLPTYTVLVPAYKEPEVIRTLLGSLSNLQYPRDKLEVLILLEEDDKETLDAVAVACPPRHVRVVLIPASEPKTKPKACNYGLQLSRGSIITIYDAEDRPEPLQLRRAAIAFSRQPGNVACVQAQLGYYNAGQNRITQWFTSEYVTWFAHFLPGLVSIGAPVPLGGTSNHMKTDILRDLGAWDPYNVTEDADLGIRLHRAGLRTGILDSLTMEEANSDFVNWAKQRSRWYKGYLQTWFVHLRSPRALRAELGWRGFLGFNLFVGGTPILSLLNPLFWSMTLLWFIAKPGFIAALFPAPWYYAALACWLIGNAAIVYMNLVSMREAGRPDLLVAALLSPLYWVMMAIAAVKAAIQLVQQPSFWEKTTHGLFVDEYNAAQTDEADRRALAS